MRCRATTAAAVQMKEVLDKAKAFSIESIKATHRHQQLQRKAKQQRNRDIVAAQRQGSLPTVKLRNEHSNGKLF